MSYFSKRPSGTSSSVKTTLLAVTRDLMEKETGALKNEREASYVRFNVSEEGENFSGKAVDSIKEEIELIHSRYNDQFSQNKRHVLEYRKELFISRVCY